MLDPEFKAKWVAALRSGRYRQAEGVLKDNTDPKHLKYCCLGVACNLINRRGWEKMDYDVPSFDDSQFVMSADTRKQIGLSYQAQKGLVKRNDRGDTFDQIANHIERRL